jgi:predicted  nucleic acid-binding Zn-ribbon protein
MTFTDKELDNALSENLKLNSLAFETDTRVATYQLLVDQTQKRIKTLSERSAKTLRDIEGALISLENESKRVTAEFDVAKRDLEKARRDRDHRLADL